jgi:hypothetical protein
MFKSTTLILQILNDTNSLQGKIPVGLIVGTVRQNLRTYDGICDVKNLDILSGEKMYQNLLDMNPFQNPTAGNKKKFIEKYNEEVVPRLREMCEKKTMINTEKKLREIDQNLFQDKDLRNIISSYVAFRRPRKSTRKSRVRSSRRSPRRSRRPSRSR